MSTEKLFLADDRPPRRLVAPSGLPQFSEHAGCGWVILQPVRTWQDWQELARQILETDGPE